MKARFGLAILVLVFGTSVARAQETRYDGTWWSNQSEGFKLGFASGYAMAMTSVADDSTFRCIAAKNGGSLPEKYPGDEVLKACLATPETARLDYGHLRIGQLVEGLDQFYKDFRNSNIEIKMAMLYVKDQLRATKTNKELEDELAALRQSANK